MTAARHSQLSRFGRRIDPSASGTHGSLSVDLSKGTFFDHEANEGGGILDFIGRETGARDGERWEQLEHLTGFKREPRPNTKARARNGDRLGPVVATYEYQDLDGVAQMQGRVARDEGRRTPSSDRLRLDSLASDRVSWAAG